MTEFKVNYNPEDTNRLFSSTSILPNNRSRDKGSPESGIKATLPRSIAPSHWDEWINESCVSPSITATNIKSFDGKTEASTIASVLNWKKWVNDFGGWWVSGVDPLTNEPASFGQFKPDKATGKAKYLAPKGKESEAIFLYDPDKPDFWQQEVTELIITEGAKKAGAALSQGIACTCLTGVWNGQINKERLIPTLRDFIRSQPKGLKVKLAFDADLWSNRQVGKALLILGDLLEANDCSVEVTDLSTFGGKKGIDDIIRDNGVEAFRKALDNSYPLSTYHELVDNLPLSAIQEGFQHLYERDKWIAYDGQLCRWNGKCFEPQSEEEEMSRIGKWCRNFQNSIFQDQFQDKEGIYTTPHSKPSMPGHIYREALQELYVNPEQVNPPNVLNLRDKVLELVWGDDDFEEKVYDHNPLNYWKFTYHSEVPYKPHIDPTYCDQLLEAIPEKYRDIVLKNMASALDLNEVRHRVGDDVRSLILWGSGSNGKDAIRMALFNIFSERYLTSLTLSHFQAADKSGRGFTLVPLLSSKINWSSENKGKLNIDQIDALKNVLTGDPITIERKNVDSTQMEADAICIFNTNHEPNIKGYDEAVRRRLSVVKMDRTFKQNPKNPGEIQGNPNFKNGKWLAEHVSPALLNVLLYKLHDLLKNGIDYEPTTQVMSEIAEESDHFIRFAKEVGLEEDSDSAVTTDELWLKMREWYFQEGIVENAQGVITPENTEEDRFINFSKFDTVVTSKEAAVKRALSTFGSAKRGQVKRDDGSRPRAIRGIRLDS